MKLINSSRTNREADRCKGSACRGEGREMMTVSSVTRMLGALGGYTEVLSRCDQPRSTCSTRPASR